MSPLSFQGDLVYVNYGRTEDFFQLERQMDINVTGKIVIVRYGKIFRGNKVGKVLVITPHVKGFLPVTDYCTMYWKFTSQKQVNIAEIAFLDC